MSEQNTPERHKIVIDSILVNRWLRNSTTVDGTPSSLVPIQRAFAVEDIKRACESLGPDVEDASGEPASNTLWPAVTREDDGENAP